MQINMEANALPAGNDATSAPIAQQQQQFTWETMMRRRSSMSAVGRRLSLLGTDKDLFGGFDDTSQDANLFVDPFTSTGLMDPRLSGGTVEPNQFRKNSLLGGVIMPSNGMNPNNGAPTTANDGNNFMFNSNSNGTNNVLGGLSAVNNNANFLNINTSNGNGALWGNMQALRNNSILGSMTRSSFLGTTSTSNGTSRNSFVGSMRNNILGSMRNSLALGSITPNTDQMNFNTNMGGDQIQQGQGNLGMLGVCDLSFPNGMMNAIPNLPLFPDTSKLGQQQLPPQLDGSSADAGSALNTSAILNTPSNMEGKQLVPQKILSGNSFQEQQPTTPMSVSARSCITASTQNTEATALTLSSSVAPPGLVQNPFPPPGGLIEEDDDDEGGDGANRFKPFHEEKWTMRYKELLQFHAQHGHAAVPHTYPPNPQLARWVKRQRRQYKLRRDGRPSTMTTERLEMLSSVGFIWDSHDVNWREKLHSLTQYRLANGHCNVPSNYSDKKLATWVKCQRRQYKLYWDGKPSAMNPDRIKELEKAGFEWEIRSTSQRTQSGTSGNSIVKPPSPAMPTADGLSNQRQVNMGNSMGITSIVCQQPQMQIPSAM